MGGEMVRTSLSRPADTSPLLALLFTAPRPHAPGIHPISVNSTLNRIMVRSPPAKATATGGRMKHQSKARTDTQGSGPGGAETSTADGLTVYTDMGGGAVLPVAAVE